MLQNCTVIEGSLQIVLFESKVDFSRFQFPRLREITDYLFFYRIKYLKSLGQLFPNLSVIRGQNLFNDRYAFVAFDVEHLEDLGLASLTHIEHGAVRIDKNPNLCYLESINWNLIVNESYIDDNFINKVKFEGDCNEKCPRTDKGLALCRLQDDKSGRRLCWNDKHCQIDFSSAQG